MNKIVLIHPEGTRTPDGKLGEFKLGVERLAEEADVPVLPVKIEGAYEIYPKGKKLPHIFRRHGRYVLKIHFLKQKKEEVPRHSENCFHSASSVKGENNEYWIRCRWCISRYTDFSVKGGRKIL